MKGAAVSLISAAALAALLVPLQTTEASGVVSRVHFAVVPQRACRSTYASTGTGRPYPAVPRWRVVAIPGDLTGQVAVYTDSRQYLRVVGPRGWNCVASLENGPLDMTIFAPHQRNPGFYFHQAGSGRRSGLEAINLLSYNGGSVADLLLACPYFRQARAWLYKDNPGHGRPTAEFPAENW